MPFILNSTRDSSPRTELEGAPVEGPSRPVPPGQPFNERVFALAEVVLAAVAGSLLGPVLLSLFGVSVGQAPLSSGVLGLLLFVDATLTIACLWGLQLVRGRSIASLGWSREGRARELWVGLKIFPVLVLFMMLLSLVFEAFLPTWVTRENLILAMIQRPSDLVIFLGASLYAGGVKEELQRAFILSRFEEHLGGALPGLILWSVAFGSLHLVQGADNALKAGALGLVLGLLYWKRRRLEGPMLAHALFDAVVVILVYFFPGLAGSG